MIAHITRGPSLLVKQAAEGRKMATLSGENNITGQVSRLCPLCSPTDAAVSIRMLSVVHLLDNQGQDYKCNIMHVGKSSESKIQGPQIFRPVRIDLVWDSP